MRMLHPRQDMTCPNGGNFYRCTGGFVGCCLVEACNPGAGCPADKDTTPDRSYSSGLSSKTSVATVATTPTSATPTSSPPISYSSVSSMLTPTTLPSTKPASSSSSDASAVSQSSSTGIPTSTAAPGATPEHSHTPTVAIVGGVLGVIILFIVIIGLIFCIRRQKRTKVYKAAVYPSPLVGSDMSPQLPAYQEPKTPRLAGASGLLGSKRRLSRHGDRETPPAAELGETLPRHILYAELPADEHHVRDV